MDMAGWSCATPHTAQYSVRVEWVVCWGDLQQETGYHLACYQLALQQLAVERDPDLGLVPKLAYINQPALVSKCDTLAKR
eukprot:1159510-Pelagomonas_calceolata.AAC.3